MLPTKLGSADEKDLLCRKLGNGGPATLINLHSAETTKLGCAVVQTTKLGCKSKRSAFGLVDHGATQR